MTKDQNKVSLNIWHAIPFWISLSLLPVIYLAAKHGGAWLFAPALYAWTAFILLDFITGQDKRNADPNSEHNHLFWYRLITLIWAPVQFVMIFGAIWYVTQSDHLTLLGKFALFFGIGVASGTVGITYAHELMHQRNRLERWLADLLLAMVLYSHFRSEHLLVHHRYVATPKDPVTARYNEEFHSFFRRVLVQCYKSAFRAEAAMLARKGLGWLDASNPFWRYWALQAGFLLLAMILGGWTGVALFLFQALVAVWQLELVNYIEHYGLTRKHLGDGKYEPVQPRHSWNASHRASNWLLINLQRHSDHHYKPDRRFPLLQCYTEADAPQLPYSYPLMTLVALIPPVWRRMMNPRVRKWRAMYYPEITDWSAYKAASNPMPR